MHTAVQHCRFTMCLVGSGQRWCCVCVGGGTNAPCAPSKQLTVTTHIHTQYTPPYTPNTQHTQALQSEVRLQRLAAAAGARERDAALRSLKAADAALAAAGQELPPLRIARGLAEKEAAVVVGGGGAAVAAEAGGVRREVDFKLAALLQVGGCGAYRTGCAQTQRETQRLANACGHAFDNAHTHTHAHTNIQTHTTQEETLGKDKTALFGILRQEVRVCLCVYVCGGAQSCFPLAPKLSAQALHSIACITNKPGAHTLDPGA